MYFGGFPVNPGLPKDSCKESLSLFNVSDAWEGFLFFLGPCVKAVKGVV